MARVGIGLDGCRGGWVAARLGDGGHPELTLLPRIEALEPILAAAAPAACLIDIPIGIPLAGERPVDAAAKALLGSAAASVFTIPPRPAFDALDFEEAQRLSRAAMGKGFSMQTWNILPKIREVDLWLRRRGATVLREAHPELVFRGLARMAGAEGPLASKKTAEGQAQRIAVLVGQGIDLAELGPRRSGATTAAVDDVLDAIVLAVAARLPADALGTVPESPQRDALGLPMEMVVPAALLGS